MTDAPDPASILRSLRRTHQTRRFEPGAPIPDEAVDAIVDVARWSGSMENSQPWRFITVREAETLRAVAKVAGPNAGAIETAAAAIGIVMPVQEGKAVAYAFDEARAAERMLVAATMVGIAAGLLWLASAARPAVAELLGIPEGRTLRTMIVLGRPTADAEGPTSARGGARLPRSKTVFAERWRR